MNRKYIVAGAGGTAVLVGLYTQTPEVGIIGAIILVAGLVAIFKKK